MTWTTVRPMTAGYFWYREAADVPPRVVQVFGIDRRGRLDVAEFGDVLIAPLARYLGEWAGPILVPQ